MPALTVNWGGSETVSAEDYLAYAGSLLRGGAADRLPARRVDAAVARRHEDARGPRPLRGAVARGLPPDARGEGARPAGGRDRSGMTDGVAVPFEIAVPEAALDDLAIVSRRTRFADDFANDDWSFGVPARLPARARRLLARRVRLAGRKKPR